MTYNPINTDVYTAAYAGAIAGMAVTGWITDSNQSNYADVTLIAGAFAQAFDQAWNNAGALNELEIKAITEVVQSDIQNHIPTPFSDLIFQDVNNWTIAAKACVAIILESDSFFNGQGIIPIKPVANIITQKDWYIDINNGNDSNNGSISAPLKTLLQLVYRWGNTPILSGPTQIHLAFGNYGSTQIVLNFAMSTAGQYFSIDAAANDIISDTVGLFTAPSFVTNRQYLITGTLIADWTPYLNKRIRFANGAICFILKVNPFGLGNNTAEISNPIREPVAPYKIQFGFPVDYTPVPGTAFTIQDLSTITSLTINNQTAPSAVLEAGFLEQSGNIIKSINIPNLSINITSPQQPESIIWGCINSVESENCESTYTNQLWGCLLIVKNIYIANNYYYGCGIIPSASLSAILPQINSSNGQFQKCTFEGLTLIAALSGVWIDKCGIFNSAGDGLQTLGQCYQIFIGDGIFGQGNARGASFAAETSVYVHNGAGSLKLTGAAGDWRFGSGSIFNWSDAPRVMNFGSGKDTLLNGTKIVTVKNLPADAKITVTINTPNGAGSPGILSVPDAGITANSFTVNSNVATDNSTFNYIWSSPSSGNAAIYLL